VKGAGFRMRVRRSDAGRFGLAAASSQSLPTGRGPAALHRVVLQCEAEVLRTGDILDALPGPTSSAGASAHGAPARGL
jgi:hypothetical protein